MRLLACFLVVDVRGSLEGPVALGCLSEFLVVLSVAYQEDRILQQVPHSPATQAEAHLRDYHLLEPREAASLVEMAAPHPSQTEGLEPKTPSKQNHYFVFAFWVSLDGARDRVAQATCEVWLYSVNEMPDWHWGQINSSAFGWVYGTFARQIVEVG